MANGDKQGQPEPRHEFVGMMFAVTVGEIGIKFSDVVRAGPPLDYLAAYTHLLLAVIVVATSWVGWTKSPSSGARKELKNPLESEFLVLLVDVILVICYFVLVRLVDYTPAEGLEHSKYIPSAAPESRWILYIFGIYFIWDILAKFRDIKAKSTRQPALVRVLVTLICSAIALLILLLLGGVGPVWVPWVDFSLIALVFLFRAGKEWATAHYALLPEPNSTRITNNPKRRATKLVVALFLALSGIVLFTTLNQ